jgi:DNA-directed RNA polymerase subunit beta'
MVLGIYYLTQERPGAYGEGKYFKSKNEAILAYENGAVTLHSKIKVRVSRTMADGTEMTGVIETTVGRILFNEIIPQDLGFVDREDPENALKLEVDFLTGKKQLKAILTKTINIHGATVTAEVLDAVKAMGYKYSTIAAMTVSISDMTVPPEKPKLIEEAQNTVDKIARNYRRGFLTEEELHLVKRARNHTTTAKPRGASPIEYKWATGFEALIGWLYVTGQGDRMNELLEMAAGDLGDRE